MATVNYWGLTSIKGSITGLTLTTTTVDQLITSVATAEGLSTEYYHISLSTDPSKNDVTYGDSSTKLSDMGFTDGCTVYCTPNQDGSREYRQIQKLDIAQRKRLGGLAADSTQGDYYRILNTYDRSLLPTQYSGNTVVNNDNTGGLYTGRPWITPESNPSTSIRSFLSGSGQTAYDAASSGAWFSVSSTDWDAAVAGISGSTKMLITDAQMLEANGSPFSADYILTQPQAAATVPASNYIFALKGVTGRTNQTWRVHGGTAYKSLSYAVIGSATPATGASGTYYYLRKAPAAQVSTTYIGISGSLTLDGMTSTTLFPGSAYLASPYNTGSWGAWNGVQPKVQVVITSTEIV